MSNDRQGARLRATAAEVVDAVVTSGRSLDAALSVHESRVMKEDRALLRLLCYGTLRRHWRLQSWIAQLLDRPLKRRDSVVNALLAIGLYQLFVQEIKLFLAIIAPSGTPEAMPLPTQTISGSTANCSIARTSTS